MLLCFMGASCTGKSTAADEMIKTINGKVYSGKDYLKIAKNKEDAEKAFKSILEESKNGGDNIIYVVSEIEDLILVPEKTFRVLFITELDIMNSKTNYLGTISKNMIFIWQKSNACNTDIRLFVIVYIK